LWDQRDGNPLLIPDGNLVGGSLAIFVRVRSGG